jgi:hypothetical protein
MGSNTPFLLSLVEPGVIGEIGIQACFSEKALKNMW